MGAGFALFVSEKEIDRLMVLASGLDFKPIIAGYIEKSNDRNVVIKPKNLIYKGETLQIR